MTGAGVYWASFVYLVFAFAFILLPFIPLVVEIYRREDARPSEIPRSLLSDPRQDAAQSLWFHAYQLKLRSLEELASHVQASPTVEHASGTLILRQDAQLPESSRHSHILTYGPLVCPPGRKLTSKILSLTSAELGDDGEFLEIHCRDRLALGQRSRILWWASAAEVLIGRGSTLLGKIAAGRRIQLADRTRFQLLEAPSIDLGHTEPLPEIEEIASPWELLEKKEPGVRRQVVRRNTEIPANARIEPDLIVHGRLTIGAGAILLGSVKCNGELRLRPGARVRGSVFARRGIRLETGVEVRGTVAAEEGIEIGAGVRIGTAKNPVTVIGSSILVKGAARVHGTMRAWRGGEVRLS